jgi:hypothetical protein
VRPTTWIDNECLKIEAYWKKDRLGLRFKVGDEKSLGTVSKNDKFGWWACKEITQQLVASIVDYTLCAIWFGAITGSIIYLIGSCTHGIAFFNNDLIFLNLRQLVLFTFTKSWATQRRRL